MEYPFIFGNKSALFNSKDYQLVSVTVFVQCDDFAKQVDLTNSVVEKILSDIGLQCDLVMFWSSYSHSGAFHVHGFLFACELSLKGNLLGFFKGLRQRFNDLVVKLFPFYHSDFETQEVESMRLIRILVS